MYAAPVAPPTSGVKNAWPLAAVCCLGILGFMIAATIVLALIPLYLSTRTVAPVANTNINPKFFAQYSADAPGSDNTGTGSVTDLDALARSMGLTGTKISSGQSQATFTRRKRGVLNRRLKRTLKMNVLLTCEPKISATCNSDKCVTRAREKSKLEIQNRKTLSNIPFRIRIKGVVRSFTLNLVFVGITTLRPIGFAGEASSSIFVAIKSGAFNDPLTWADGIVPYGDCSVVISAGVTVTLARSELEIRVKKFDVFGNLALGSGSATFKFLFATNILIRAGGILQDMTTEKRILVAAGSLVTILPGGRVSSSVTVLQTFSATGLGASVVLPSSGPFTGGVLASGVILSYNKVTFIAIASGGFTSGDTFLGGEPPSADICSSTVACGVAVTAGVTLSTADLNGKLDLNIDLISVVAGAVLELGTPGSSAGFKFKNKIKLDVFGKLAAVFSGGGIRLPFGSILGIRGGATFTSLIISFIQSFNSLTDADVGPPVVLPLFFSGPLFYQISSTGLIVITITDPDDLASQSTTPAGMVTGALG